MVINPIVGVYIPTIRIPIKGGMTIPTIATFDHGTFGPRHPPVDVARNHKLMDFYISIDLYESFSYYSYLAGF